MNMLDQVQVVNQLESVGAQLASVASFVQSAFLEDPAWTAVKAALVANGWAAPVSPDDGVKTPEQTDTPAES